MGSVSYPDMVANSTTIATDGGLVRATLVIANNVEVQAVLRCVGASNAVAGRTSYVVQVTAGMGSCVLEIHLPSSEFRTGLVGRYGVHIDYSASATQ